MDILLELKTKIGHPSTKVVFPEGENERTILAAASVAREKIAKPILLGREDAIRKLAAGVVADLKDISIVDMFSSSKLDEYAKQYSDNRDLPIGAARLILSKPVYFGAMMVKTGDADAMVGGIATPTEEVVMASELFIGMQKKISDKANIEAYYNPILRDFNYSKVVTRTPGYVETWSGEVHVYQLFGIEFTYNFNYGSKVKKINRSVDYEKEEGKGGM